MLLDEPSAGVAQRETEALGPLLRDVQAETGCSIVVIEHDMACSASLCDDFVALEQGGVIASGTPAQVLADPGSSAPTWAPTRTSSTRGANPTPKMVLRRKKKKICKKNIEPVTLSTTNARSDMPAAPANRQM